LKHLVDNWTGQSGKPDEYVALDWQTQEAAFTGQWRRAQDFSRRSIDLAAAMTPKKTPRSMPPMRLRALPSSDSARRSKHQQPRHSRVRETKYPLGGRRWLWTGNAFSLSHALPSRNCLLSPL
jgi:hypothetical protein